MKEETVQRALRIAAILFFLLLVVFATFHQPTRFEHTLQKLAHPVTFGAVALLMLTLLKCRRPRGIGCYAAAFSLTVLCGAGTEVAQGFVGRDPAVLDVLRDALGAGTALAAFAALVPGAIAGGSGVRRGMVALAAIAGFAAMAAPIGICLAAYARRDFLFPTLLEACSPLDRYFVSVRGADLRVVAASAPTASSCGSALRVDFNRSPYAGMAIDEPYPDWRSAATLLLDLRNPGEHDLPLAVRVHDRAHNHQFQDRFNREFVLRAHERLEMTIPIAEIELAPAGRAMDLARIAGIIVFRARGTTAGSFEVERILLRP